MSLPQTQEASAAFFAPVAVAYLTLCAAWWAVDRWRPLWPKPAVPRSARPWLDLGLAVAVVAAVLGVGQLYHHDLLFDRRAPLTDQVNHLLVWSPLALAVVVRRAPSMSCLLDLRRLWLKAVVGAACGWLGVTVFCGMRGEWGRIATISADVFAADNLRHFLPVFLEGVGVAFLYVRLRGVLNAVPSLLVPCLLFAVAHVPGQLADGDSLAEVAAFFALNTLLPLAIFAVVVRSRDVVWIGVAHYVMDVAIWAFD